MRDGSEKDIMMPRLLETLYESRYIADIVMIRCSEFSDNPTIKVPDRIIGGGTWIMSREKFMDMGGYQSWNGAEDTEFIERAKKMGMTVHMIEVPRYKKRFHLKSVMNSKDEGIGSRLNQKYCEMIANLKPEKIVPVFSPCREITCECEDV